MAYSPPLVKPGDLIRAELWNAFARSAVTGVEGDGRTIFASKFGNKVVLETIFRDPSEFLFLARVTNTAALDGSAVQFLYTIEEVALSISTSPDGTITGVSVSAVEGGRSGTAINLAEIQNESSGIAFSVDQAGTDYPSGFGPRPITGGGTTDAHKTDQIVNVLGRVHADDGSVIWFFDRQGIHDGTCS